MEDAGLAADDVKLVEMPYPDMQAALESGAVDAIWQVEPFQSSAKAAGLVKIGDLFSGPVADMPVAGWVTTEAFAKENPEAVEAFKKSIAASAQELQDNRERLVELVPSFTKVTADVVEAAEMPRFQGELDVEQLQKTADLMLKYKITGSELDVQSLVAESGESHDRRNPRRESAPVLDLDPFSDDFLTDPYDAHEQMREAGPVFWLERYGVYGVARHDEVARVLTDHETFVSSRGVGISDFVKEKPWRPPSLLLEADPPQHTEGAAGGHQDPDREAAALAEGRFPSARG